MTVAGNDPACCFAFQMLSDITFVAKKIGCVQSALAYLEGVEVDGMGRFTVTQLCSWLANLTVDESVACGNPTVYNLAFQAAHKYPEDYHIQVAFSRVMMNISDYDFYEPGLEQLVCAVEAFPQDQTITECFCDTLYKLLLDGTCREVLTQNHRVFVALLHASKTMPENESYRFAFEEAVSHDDTKERLITVGFPHSAIHDATIISALLSLR